MSETDPRLELFSDAIRDALLTTEDPHRETLLHALIELSHTVVQLIGVLDGEDAPSEDGGTPSPVILLPGGKGS